MSPFPLPLAAYFGTQQDGRMKRTAKRLCDKRDTASFVVIFTQHLCFLVFTKRYVQMKVKFGEKLFQTKWLSRLAHEVCRLRSSPVLLRKFTNIKKDPSLGNILLREFHRCVSYSIAILSLSFILFQSLSSLNWPWPSNLWHSCFLCACFQVVCISLEVWQRTHFTT